MLAKLAASQERHYVVFHPSMNILLFYTPSLHKIIVSLFWSPLTVFPGLFGIDKTPLSASASPVLAITFAFVPFQKHFPELTLSPPVCLRNHKS